MQGLLTQKAKDHDPLQAPELHRRAGSKVQDLAPTKASRGKPQPSVLSQAPLLRWVLTLSFLVATVAVGLYAM